MDPNPTLSILMGTAASVGFVHTLIGVDHSLPFIAIGRAKKWSMSKVLLLTFGCGLAHVLSSVVLGFVGLGFGVAVDRLNWIESNRGEITVWLLIGFGLAYASWAMVRRHRGKRHTHLHAHAEGVVHTHEHDHHQGHIHPHADSKNVLTVWSLFIIFVLGPCEPLIPLMMVPALEIGVGSTVLVVAVFSLVTIGTMLAIVAIGYIGLGLPTFRKLESHADVLAGLAIAAAGVAIHLFGI